MNWTSSKLQLPSHQKTLLRKQTTHSRKKIFVTCKSYKGLVSRICKRLSQLTIQLIKREKKDDTKMVQQTREIVFVPHQSSGNSKLNHLVIAPHTHKSG